MLFFFLFFFVKTFKNVENHEQIMKTLDLGVEIVQLGGGPPCTKRLGDRLEYDFGTFGGPFVHCTLFWGGDPPHP